LEAGRGLGMSLEGNAKCLATALEGHSLGRLCAFFPTILMTLYFFLQIGSHASRTLLSITNFGRCHASLGPLSNLQVVTQVPKLPKQCQKDEISGSNVEISKVSRKNSVAAEMLNR
jgi:hypothetical protein